MRAIRLLVLLLFACNSNYTFKETPEAEGDDPGECADGADNDEDFDCQDSDCANAPECCADADGDGTCDTADLCPAEAFQKPRFRQTQLEVLVSKYLRFRDRYRCHDAVAFWRHALLEGGAVVKWP